MSGRILCVQGCLKALAACTALLGCRRWGRWALVLALGWVLQSPWDVGPVYYSETAEFFTFCYCGASKRRRDPSLHIRTRRTVTSMAPYWVFLFNFNTWLILSSNLSLLARLLSPFCKMIRLFKIIYNKSSVGPLLPDSAVWVGLLSACAMEDTK